MFQSVSLQYLSRQLEFTKSQSNAISSTLVGCVYVGFMLDLGLGMVLLLIMNLQLRSKSPQIVAATAVEAVVVPDGAVRVSIATARANAADAIRGM